MYRASLLNPTTPCVELLPTTRGARAHSMSTLHAGHLVMLVILVMGAAAAVAISLPKT